MWKTRDHPKGDERIFKFSRYMKRLCRLSWSNCLFIGLWFYSSTCVDIVKVLPPLVILSKAWRSEGSGLSPTWPYLPRTLSKGPCQMLRAAQHDKTVERASVPVFLVRHSIDPHQTLIIFFYSGNVEKSLSWVWLKGRQRRSLASGRLDEPFGKDRIFWTFPRVVSLIAHMACICHVAWIIQRTHSVLRNLSR